MSSERLWQIGRFLIVIAGLALSSWALLFLFRYTYPFVIALVLSLLTVPIVNWLYRTVKLPRAWGTLIALVFVASATIGIVTIMVTQLVHFITIIAEQFPKQIQTFTAFIQKSFSNTIFPFLNDLYDSIQSLNPQQVNSIESGIGEIGVALASALGRFSKSIAVFIQNIFAALPLVLILFIVILLAWFFITKDWPNYVTNIQKLSQRKGFAQFERVILNLKSALFGYARAQLTLISITFVIVLIGMFILRVNSAFSFALLAAFFDILPYLGVGTLLIPWAIYAAISADWFLSIGLVVLYIIVIVQRNLAEPRIVGGQIGLSSLMTLISIFVGLQLFGVLGFILGPVTAVFLKALYNAKIFHYIWAFITGVPYKE